MLVNEKIKLIREAKGFTQEQLAEKLGISPTAYGNIERGDNDPKLSKLEKIAEILGIRLPELVDSSEKGNLNINFNKEGKNIMYVGSSSSELEKQQLIIELKDKEIAMQQREIENLKIQVLQLQEIHTLLKKNQE